MVWVYSVEMRRVVVVDQAADGRDLDIVTHPAVNVELAIHRPGILRKEVEHVHVEVVFALRTSSGIHLVDGLHECVVVVAGIGIVLQSGPGRRRAIQSWN